MKLIVMGAGYVGLELLKQLQNSSHDIYITTTRHDRVNELKPYGHVLVVTSENQNEFHSLIQECDGIIVLVAPKTSASYEDTYLNTAKLITSALQKRVKPFQIIYTGSTSVCEGLSGPISEETKLSPRSTNPTILFETEKTYLDSGVPACILRLGGIYGPGREIAERAKRFSGKEMQGTGNEPTNNIHLEDIVESILFSLKHSLVGVYHIVNDEHTSRKKLYTDICLGLKMPPPVWDGCASDSSKGYIISNQKIKDAGYIFKHPTLRG